MAAVRIMKKSQRSTSTGGVSGVNLPRDSERGGSTRPAAPIASASHLKALEAEIALYRHALENARTELQAFAYSVSHDLRAPIRAIEGFSRILLDDYAADLSPEAQKFLKHIIENTQQLSSQVEDLLKYYRLGKVVPQKIQVDSQNLVQEALADQSMPLPAGLSVSTHSLGPVVADPGQLRHVFSQLISNAIKFSRDNPNPQLEIGSRQDKNSTTFFVKDNGTGFDMQYANRLFQVFQKLHSPNEYPGNGIGLAIVKRIVESHGGCVWAESKPAEGATFFFTLPVIPPPQIVAASANQSAENSQKTA
jgi:light-regulated signal transduction histidine kinase (bacteriophytochrome)